MAFGKRVMLPPQKDETAPLPQPILHAASPAKASEVSGDGIFIDDAVQTTGTSPDIEARLMGMREWTYGLMLNAAGLATLIQSADTLDIRKLGGSNRLDSYPLPVAGFNEHFAFNLADGLHHPVYAYLYPNAPDRFDISAQVQLSELVGTAVAVNTACYQAHKDDALSVALQSHSLGRMVDKVIASAGYYAATFENMIRTQLLLSATDKPALDFDRLRERHEHYAGLARGAMLEPGRYAKLIPARHWPHVAVELVWPDHKGQRFLNEVYFPKEYATSLQAIAVHSEVALLAAVA